MSYTIEKIIEKTQTLEPLPNLGDDYVYVVYITKNFGSRKGVIIEEGDRKIDIKFFNPTKHSIRNLEGWRAQAVYVDRYLDVDHSVASWIERQMIYFGGRYNSPQWFDLLRLPEMEDYFRAWLMTDPIFEK